MFSFDMTLILLTQSQAHETKGEKTYREKKKTVNVKPRCKSSHSILRLFETSFRASVKIIKPQADPLSGIIQICGGIVVDLLNKRT